LESLRDKKVLAFKINDIHEVEIRKNQTSFLLSRRQPPVEGEAQESKAETRPSEKPAIVWQGPDGKEADRTRLDQLLATLSDVRCERYIEEKKKEEFKEPVYTVRLKGPQEYHLSIFPKAEEGGQAYPAVSSQNDYAFYLAGRIAEKIMVDPGDLIAKEPAKQEKPKAPEK
jgi:hypothetical protein